MGEEMKLYLLIRGGGRGGYDTYNSAVVAAPSPKAARNIHPSGNQENCNWNDTWCNPEQVKVECIGTAARGVKQGVICADFFGG